MTMPAHVFLAVETVLVVTAGAGAGYSASWTAPVLRSLCHVLSQCTSVCYDLTQHAASNVVLWHMRARQVQLL
jgi:hypothetical protein